MLWLWPSACHSIWRWDLAEGCSCLEASSFFLPRYVQRCYTFCRSTLKEFRALKTSFCKFLMEVNWRGSNSDTACVFIFSAALHGDCHLCTSSDIKSRYLSGCKHVFRLITFGFSFWFNFHISFQLVKLIIITRKNLVIIFKRLGSRFSEHPSIFYVPISWGERRVTPWTGCPSITRPHRHITNCSIMQPSVGLWFF